MQETATTPRGELAAAISREGVRILREYTGRGPTQARTIINPGFVAITYMDALTKGERKLVELGKSDQVIEIRREYQCAMKDDLVAMIESATGRKVIAFLSDNHLDPDIGVEAFVLEPPHEGPEATTGSSREPLPSSLLTASDSDQEQSDGNALGSVRETGARVDAAAGPITAGGKEAE